MLIAIAAILGYPLYKLVVLSFQRYGLAELIQHTGAWVGFANYSSVLHDPVFWHTLLRTVVFTAVNVGLTIGVGTLLALLLVRVGPIVRVLLTSGLVLVWSMPVVVAVQVWYWMTNFQNGILNYTLTRLHLGDYFQHDWYATTFSKLAMVTLLIVWGALPFVTITVYAGLSQVSRELVEAAEIDGAGPLRVFRDVTFPILKPILLILTSLSIIWDFGVFTQPYLLIGASHVDASNYLMGVYVYIEGYAHSNFGRGAAISLLMLVMVAAMSIPVRAPDGAAGRRGVSARAPLPRRDAARAGRRPPPPAPAVRLERPRPARLRDPRLPRVLDDLDVVQAGRRDQQPHPDLALVPSHAVALPRRDEPAVLLGRRQEQRHHRHRRRGRLDRARVPRGRRARQVPLHAAASSSSS